uniref:hypothetical protein n=1 Tax=Sphingomonas sp. CFBP 13720 TaxID=2775302 RepID=UPI0020174621|nr:hypothetical protein [Sphingomonas sp. CFBP 13720]
MEHLLAEYTLDLTATTAVDAALDSAGYVIVAALTKYDVETDKFNTSSVEAVISKAAATAPQTATIAKSTIPVGFFDEARQRLHPVYVVFSPGFP